MVQKATEEKQKMIDTLSKVVLEEDINCPSTKVFTFHDLTMALQWQLEQSGNDTIRSKLVWDCRE
jgi:hypothetical protein